MLYTVSDTETCLGIYSTNIETQYNVPTLMHDHTYRMGICWQNTAYNQPPHLGYNLALATLPPLENEMNIEVEKDKEMSFDVLGAYVSALKISRLYRPDGTSTTIPKNAGFSTAYDANSESLSITGTPTDEGEYRFVVRLTDNNGAYTYDTLHVNVIATTGIAQTRLASNVVKTTIYDVYGRLLPVQEVGQLPRGIYLIREETANGAVETRKITKN